MQTMAAAWAEQPVKAAGVRIGAQALAGELTLPPRPIGIVVSADAHDGPGLASRQTGLVSTMAHNGLGTLLFSPLTPVELQGRQRVLDMPLLSSRIAQVLAWLADRPELGALPVGLLGANQGACVALHAAACVPQRVFALVTHGGRPDLAGARLREVQAPTLLIMGNDDTGVLELGRHAARELPGTRQIEVMAGGRQLSDAAATLASRWFMQHLPPIPCAPVAAPALNPGVL